MIETVSDKDKDYITQFLSRDPELSLEDARFCVNKSDIVTVYKNKSSDVVGCGTFRLWGKEKNKADAYIYIAPESRERGIGRMLFESLLNVPQNNNIEFISTKIETNHSKSLEFFLKVGFEKWYTELILHHNMERQHECNLEFINYRKEFFEQYVDTIRRSFYDLRSSNDFQPYYCCEPDESKYRELEQNKGNIYILLDGQKLVASVIVKLNSIEDVFVSPDYQGKGVGKKMMHFAINKAIDLGSNHIELTAIEWNKRALQLYREVGFESEKKIHYLRRFGLLCKQ